ncbi:MAG: polysaccharide deacetylase family protein, partial [Bacillota bacterium]
MNINKNLFIILCVLLLFFLNNQVLFAQEQLPAIIFVYDDGHIEDIEDAFPVHQKYNVPAVSAVNSSTIGNDNYLKKEDLIKLEKNGWEIASHGKYHSALIYNTLTSESYKGDKKIRVKNPNLIESKYEYYIYDSKKGIGEVIKFNQLVENDDIRYWELEDKLKNNYLSKNTYIFLTQKSMEKEIIDSKLELREMGLKVNSFVYPYNGYIDKAKEIVKENYHFARGGRRLEEDFPECFINIYPFS